MTNNRLLRDSFILTGFSLLMRITTIAFSVYIAAKMGAEGMGLHQLILSAFSFAVTLSTAGISTATTRVLTEEQGLGHRGYERDVMGCAVSYAGSLSLVAAFVLFAFSGFIGTKVLEDARTVLSLELLAPALPLMALSACFKGYMLAIRRPIQNAVSDVIEQGVEMAVFVGVFELGGVYETGAACAAISAGITVSELVSCAYLFIQFLRFREKSGKRTQGGYMRGLLAIAAPVTGSACLASALRTVENVYIPAGLRRFGMADADALSIYGRVRGMALPIMFLPYAFLSVITSLLLPEVSEAKAAGRRSYIIDLISRVMRYTLMLALPATAVFAVFAGDISEVFYKDGDIGDIILILAPLVPLMYFDAVADGILKGLGEQNWVLRCNIVDSAIRLALVFGLVPRLGFTGFMIVMYVSNIFNPVLSIRRMMRAAGVRLNVYEWIVKPLLCAAAAALLIRPVMLTLDPGKGVTAAGIAALCAVYAVMLAAISGKKDASHIDSRPAAKLSALKRAFPKPRIR